MTYRPSTRDLSFLMHHVLGTKALVGHARFKDYDPDIEQAILDAACDIAINLLAPLNHRGDQQGVTLNDGVIDLADGFEAAIKDFGQNGWYGLTASAEYGGQSLPKTLELACFEMFYGANMAFTMLPTLPVGAAAALEAHASEDQKAYYVPKLLTGAYLASMALTEPQAGTDLAALNTQAVPDGEGRYRLYGQKIFISWADHQASDNIVHLVLARLPDAPPGTKGISLFLCPKYLNRDLGTHGQRNDYKIIGIEHKMGLHASPTCSMSFEGAYAELMGAPHSGLAAMFTMMNEARMGVGTQGAGQSDRAFCQALEFAKQRPQGRSMLTGHNNAPIYDHPDVRLMLGIMKARAEAARMICLQAGFYCDLAKIAPPETALDFKQREDFLVPIAKAWSTETGVEVTSMGIQVHGGMGFIEETGAAQPYRDIRIATIYEGTNGIQALDLMGRKLGTDGRAAKLLITDMRETIALCSNEMALMELAAALDSSLVTLEAATQMVLKAKSDNMADAATGASAYLMLWGDILGAWLWLRTAFSSHIALKEADADLDWLNTKIALAHIYYAHVLARAEGRLAAIGLGADWLKTLNL